MDSVRSPAHQLARQLAMQRIKLVLAESCTAGEAASQLGRVPGISHWWCGSCVTYRPQEKAAWLRVPIALIDQFTAESAQVTQAMTQAILAMTPEADLAGAITGHLGPSAPDRSDGLVFAATMRRGQDPTVTHHHLTQATRRRRQIEAAHVLLRRLLESVLADAGR